jgi:hypothetical protein
LILSLTLTGTALAQQPPSENKGMSATPLAAFDLSKQGLKDFDQRQMRMRVIQVEPVARAFHSHSAPRTYTCRVVCEHRKAVPTEPTPQARLSSSTDVDHWPRTKAPRPLRSSPSTCSRDSVPTRQCRKSI